MLHTSKFYVVKAVGRHVRVIRSASPFETLESMMQEHARLLNSLPTRNTKGLLVDLRDAPGRNDPAFEEAMGDWRRGFARRYARVAILLRSVTGMMQVKRLIASDKTPHVLTFNTEQAAVEYAEG